MLIHSDVRPTNLYNLVAGISVWLADGQCPFDVA